VKQEKSHSKEGTAGSRSTSAGSSTPPSRNTEDSPKLQNLSASFAVATGTGLPEFEYPSSFAMQNAPGLPNIEYPSPYSVKNTFIDTTKFFGPTSLDGFLRERKIQSCPASGIGAPPGLEAEVEAPMLDALDAESFAEAVALAALDTEVDYDSIGESTPSPFGMLQEPPSFGFSMQFPPMPAPPCQDMPVFDCLMPPPPQDMPVFDCLMPPPPVAPPVLSLELDEACLPPPPETSALAPVLRLADALPEPELGSPELPSFGSTGHRTGTCRPCAFFHSKGCGNGTQCTFCHLCAPGEKKRRLKEKRVMQQMEQAAAAAVSNQWPAIA